MLNEKIFLNCSNSIDLNFQRKVDGLWQDFPLIRVTRVILSEINGEWSIDSEKTSNVFSWPISGYPSRMKITAGGEDIENGTYNCYVKLYMPGYSNGYRWNTILGVMVI